MQPITREAIIERRQSYLRWSAVLGGTALAVGVWTLLEVFGMGIGLAAVETDDAGSLRTAGIATGIWSLIAPLIAMFIGAWLVGRMSGAVSRTTGALHGSVMWALALVIGLWGMFALVSSVAGGVARAGSVATSATSSAVSGMASAGGNVDVGNAMSALGLTSDDLLAPINERLEREGKPPVTAHQLTATVRALAQRGLHEGRLDRQTLVEELARNTNLSQADAEDIANRYGARYQELANRLTTAGERAKTVALTAADRTGKGLLLGGVMMLLSLAAALGGGALGVNARRDREEVRPPYVPPQPATTTTTTTTEP